MKSFFSVIISLFLCLAASAQEHFLEIIKAEQVKNNSVIRSLQRGESVPGMTVNDEKDVRVGRKLSVGETEMPKKLLLK
ncbi:MAG: hypothetical protein BWK80_07095 [Desulfobacteraceae bacterium IS3]|jgi:hypothetical protein|nr:MAG: hypothetical protein BWK80_07095 [Desulfobacteraceae bacterium IS3]HAO19722.1 hypothetical protein [Desulfobacteraceae bacterium]